MNDSGIEVDEVFIKGKRYVPADSVAEKAKPGKRAVLVLDRGWVVAGDVEDVDGRIKVTRAIHVRRWDEIGFDGMVADPKSKRVTLKPIPNGFDCPADAELFRVPVEDSWGL